MFLIARRHRYVTGYAGGVARLIVENAQSRDSGEYTCVAVNDRDRASTTGFLTVYTSPSVFGAPNRPSPVDTVAVVNKRFDSRYAWTGDDILRPGKSAAGHYCTDWRTADDVARRRPKYPSFVTSVIADDVATYGGTIALQVRVQGT